MTTFKHLVPANVFGISAPVNPVQDAFVLQDVENYLGAQASPSPAQSTLAGYIPCTSDGAGGLQQFARDIDASSYNGTSTTGFSASITGTSVTLNYPSVNVLWNGAIQTLKAGSITATVSTGTWFFTIGYYWGLTHTALVQSFTFASNVCALLQLAVNTTAETVSLSSPPPNVLLLRQFGVLGPTSSSTANGIPTSDQNGNMAW